jgi:hypothetical protein
MVMAPLFVSAFLDRPSARLNARTSRLSRLHEFKDPTLAPFFPEPLRGEVDFSPLVLATHNFASQRLEPLFTFLPSPRDARGQRGIDSSKCVTCVWLFISQAHSVVLPCVPHARLLALHDFAFRDFRT